jgi:hypothetical protein
MQALRKRDSHASQDDNHSLLINNPPDLPIWMMVLRFCLEHKTCRWVIIVLPIGSWKRCLGQTLIRV